MNIQCKHTNKLYNKMHNWQYTIKDIDAVLKRNKNSKNLIKIRREVGVDKNKKNTFNACTVLELKKLIDRREPNTTYHEIFNTMTKVFFDIDSFPPDHEKMITMNIIKTFKQVCPYSGHISYIVCSSTSSKKGSAHVIFPQLCVSTDVMRKFILPQMSEISPYIDQYVDAAVYRKNGQLRCLNSIKYERIGGTISTRQKICKNAEYNIDTFNSSCISLCDNCINLNLQYSTDYVDKNFEINCNYTPSQVGTIKREIRSTFKNAIMVNQIKNTLVELRKVKPYFCIICNRVHQNENPYCTIRMNGDVLYRCRRYSDKKASKCICNIGSVINDSYNNINSDEDNTDSCYINNDNDRKIELPCDILDKLVEFDKKRYNVV